ncbi:hypothetical protein IFM89_007360 [Coptis chinensis]|uniref:Nuclear pore complex protein n=1 Tax=Coptis chinensis TaxID=261450 RepID=A0A835LEL3_9MAGN|nr:hypothetical protein IFM89_007360 [Coptis chinensis]
MEIQRSLRGISGSAVTSSVMESDVASPAELAKAYMGNGSLKGSPLASGLRSQAFRKEVPPLSNIPFTPKSSGLSLAPRSASGVSENGYTMPRPRGRSAIYSMARMPISRVYGNGTGKIDGYVTSSSQLSFENSMVSGGRQSSKRRSSFLDSDIGSVGPIRRIRQKTIMMSPPKNLSLSTSGSALSISINGNGSDIAQGSRSQMLLDEPKDNISNIRSVENENNGILKTSSAFVSTQSSEMAEKILMHLDQTPPTPKEKLAELKLAVAREKSPTKLTHNMLHGKALRSLEHIDSSKLLYNVPHPVACDSQDAGHLGEARDSTFHKQDKLENGGPTLAVASDKKLAPKENGLQTKASTNENMSSGKASESEICGIDACPSQKKRPFRMSAHELCYAYAMDGGTHGVFLFSRFTIDWLPLLDIFLNFLDLDDDTDSDGVPSRNEKEKLNTSASDSKAVTVGTGTLGNHSVFSEIKSPAKPVLQDGADTKADIVSTATEKDGDFAFPAIPASSTITPLASPAPHAHLFSNGAAPSKEMTAAPNFGFIGKIADKGLPFEFSSKSSGVNEPSGLISSVQSEPKLETQSSTTTVSVTIINPPSVVKSDESDNSLKNRDLTERPENFVSVAASSPATVNMFSTGVSTISPKINYEPLSVTSSLPVSAAQTLNGSSGGIFSVTTNISTTPTTSPFTSTTASDSSANVSAQATSTFTGVPLFKFGSDTAAAPPLSTSLPSTTSGINSTNSDLKDKMTSPFGSLTSSPFGASSSSGLASTGSSIFGFTASATSNLSTSASNQSESSNPFGTGVGSSFGAHGAPTETKSAAAPFTNSMPNPFGLSATSSTAGQSASSSLSSGSSLFSSATLATNIFGSSSGFGINSSTSTGASSFSSSSGTNLFGSSLPSNTPSIFSSGFGSVSSSTGFPFGASSVAAPSISAPIVFGSSKGSSAPVFSFSQAGSTTSSASLPSQPVFGTPNPVAPFGSNLQSTNQMNMEDSMAEDTVQASNPVISAFGQPTNSPAPGNFMFGPGPPSGGALFQFGGQQNLGALQNPSPFQTEGNLNLSGGSSFSLGTGGVDKSNRRIIKAKRGDKTRRR